MLKRKVLITNMVFPQNNFNSDVFTFIFLYILAMGGRIICTKLSVIKL